MAVPPLALAALALLAAAAAPQEAPAAGGPIDPELLDGPTLFARACATCHGLDGSGTGPTVLDRPARNFKEGGFSFGNTPEAVFRTLTHGIPGTPMPAWEQALTEGQRRVLAEHVLSLGPPQREVSDEETRLSVGDEPVFVRGILPPVDEGARQVPRGLLAGTPDGLSFQYDLDGLRLLAVRAGEFARRTDWGGRGGTPLEPLGRVVWSDAGETPRLRWESAGRHGERRPLRARLLATHLAGTRAEISWALVGDGDGAPVALVTESPSAAVAHELPGFRRRLRLAPAPGTGVADLRLVLDDGAPVTTRIEPAAWPAGAVPLDARPHWRLVERGESAVEVLGLAAPVLPRPGAVTARRRPAGVELALQALAGTEIELTILATTHLTPEAELALRAENQR